MCLRRMILSPGGGGAFGAEFFLMCGSQPELKVKGQQLGRLYEGSTEKMRFQGRVQERQSHSGRGAV